MAIMSGGGLAAQTPAPLWVAYADAFSEAECARLVSLVAERPYKDAGLVEGRSEESVRRTHIHWLAEDESTAWVYGRLAAIVARANREAFHFALTGFDEDAQIGRYGEGHFYDWHIDRGGRGAGAHRKLTVAVQLSEPGSYDGGDLELNPNGHIVAAPRAQGTAVVFPAYTLHRVAPISRGVRHSLVIWTHGPAFT